VLFWLWGLKRLSDEKEEEKEKEEEEDSNRFKSKVRSYRTSRLVTDQSVFVTYDVGIAF
jgi:hypothetical protein